MELAHSLLLNEEALARISESKKSVFVFEWLRFLDKVLVAAQKVRWVSSKGCMVWGEIKSMLWNIECYYPTQKQATWSWVMTVPVCQSATVLFVSLGLSAMSADKVWELWVCSVRNGPLIIVTTVNIGLPFTSICIHPCNCWVIYIPHQVLPSVVGIFVTLASNPLMFIRKLSRGFFDQQVLHPLGVINIHQWDYETGVVFTNVHDSIAIAGSKTCECNMLWKLLTAKGTPLNGWGWDLLRINLGVLMTLNWDRHGLLSALLEIEILGKTILLQDCALHEGYLVMESDQRSN